MAKPNLEPTGPLEHLKWLRGIRDASHVYHRWGTGAGRRLQWKPTPASTRTKSIEGDAGPGELDATIERIEGDPSAVSESGERKKRVVRPDADLRRYTVNSHPALARALAKMVAAGEKDLVIAVMAELAQGVAAKFQEITGRKCVALSVHFDSAMPHWNIWHSGVERVIFPVGKNKRVRYRRTAFDLNSSGNLLAWHRTRLAFERLGKDFRALSSRTVMELEKGLKRAMDRQNRPPGDWTINEEADLLLEAALRGRGKAAEVEAGFKEFVENEEKRYRDGVAGRGPKDARKLSVLFRDHESADDAIERLKRADEIEEIEKNLRPREGESLTDCSARVVERTQELAEELSSSAHVVSVLRTERDELKIQIGKSEKVIAQVSSVLEPRPGESLAAAARSLAARAMEAISLKAKAKKIQTEGEELCVENAALTSQVGELEKQLGSEQEKVRRLEEEITPLRVLRDRVKELLKELKASPLAQKFDAGLKLLLSKVGKLVEIALAPRIKEPAPEKESE
jgi:NADH:ubiquinone oxidoreductase subunit C